MKDKIIIILLFICSSVSAQYVDPNGTISSPKWLITPIDGLYAPDSVTIGIRNKGISTNKIAWMLGPNLKFDSLTGRLDAIIPAASSSSGTTDYKYIVAPKVGNQIYTIPGLPVNYADYDIFKNGVHLNPIKQFTANGEVLTFIVSIVQGNIIYYSRKK